MPPSVNLTRLVLTCRDECVKTMFGDFAHLDNKLCKFLMLVGPAGSGKTSCIGIMIDGFLNSCWQFATRNAHQAAYEYISHTGRHYATTYQMLCIDVSFMDAVSEEMKNIPTLINMWAEVKDLSEFIEAAEVYFKNVTEDIFARCRDKRKYLDPQIVKDVIDNMKKCGEKTITREKIVLYLEMYCLKEGKSFACIPPEIRYSIFGFDEAGRTHMVFFLLNYYLFVYVNKEYGMPPEDKPTYIFVGSHTQGDVIHKGDDDFWMNKYSLITMITLSWMAGENIMIKGNMYNRRSPTRNEYTMARNLLIKRAEEGLHIDVEDIKNLQKLHTKVFGPEEHFGPFDKDVVVFAATHAKCVALTTERFKNEVSVKIEEYLALNKCSLLSSNSAPPPVIDELHHNINSMFQSECYENGWINSREALNYATRQECFFNNTGETAPFEPETAYEAERYLKLNTLYITIIKWKVSMSRLKGPLHKVLDDLDQLNVSNMSENLIIELIKGFDKYISQSKSEEDDIDMDRPIANPYFEYYKLHNELRQIANRDGSDAVEMDILLQEKMWYTLPPNSIVSLVQYTPKRLWMKMHDTIGFYGYQLRYKRKNTLAEILSKIITPPSTKGGRKKKKADAAAAAPSHIYVDEDFDDIIEESVGYEEDCYNIIEGEAAPPPEPEPQPQEEPPLLPAGTKRKITKQEVADNVKSRRVKGLVVWYIFPIVSVYARTISVSQGSTVKQKHVVIFNNSKIQMQNVIVGITRANNPKNQKILLPQTNNYYIVPLPKRITDTNRVMNVQKIYHGVL